MGLTMRETQTVGNRPVSPPKTNHFKFSILAPIKYLRSDRTVTWSICSLCSFRHSCTSRCQICERSNICWVAIENPWISHKICYYFKVTPGILVQSPISKRVVEELLKLHNLLTDHVTIQSECRYHVEANVAGTVDWSRSPVSTGTTTCGYMSGSCCLAVPDPDRGLGFGSWPVQGPWVWFQPRPKPRNLESLLTLILHRCLRTEMPSVIFTGITKNILLTALERWLHHNFKSPPRSWSFGRHYFTATRVNAEWFWKHLPYLHSLQPYRETDLGYYQFKLMTIDFFPSKTLSNILCAPPKVDFISHVLFFECKPRLNPGCWN